MASISRLTVYPVKGLDGVSIDSSEFTAGGTLAMDRSYALFDDDGNVLNGKRTAKVHHLRTAFDPETASLRVRTRDGSSQQFDLAEVDGRESAAAWFSEFFDETLTVVQKTDTAFVDRPAMGPSVVSTATIRTIASWFQEMTVEGARRRLRANVEISGVPPFWEDRFVGSGKPAFEAGGVRFEGITPCGRCIVPERDPDTGERIQKFREQFVTEREKRFPEWASEEAFDQYYCAMILTRIPEADRNRRISVGDSVSVIDEKRTQ